MVEQPGRQLQSAVQGRRPPVPGEIDDEGTFLQETSQRIAELHHRQSIPEIPVRCREESAVLRLKHPKGARGTIEDVGDRPERTPVQILATVVAREALDEVQPDLPIIIFVAEEMLADEDPEAVP